MPQKKRFCNKASANENWFGDNFTPYDNCNCWGNSSCCDNSNATPVIVVATLHIVFVTIQNVTPTILFCWGCKHFVEATKSFCPCFTYRSSWRRKVEHERKKDAILKIYNEQNLFFFCKSFGSIVSQIRKKNEKKTVSSEERVRNPCRIQSVQRIGEIPRSSSWTRYPSARRRNRFQVWVPWRILESHLLLRLLLIGLVRSGWEKWVKSPIWDSIHD